MPRRLRAGRRAVQSDAVSTLDFWYDFASTYSYPAAMRIADVARAAGVTVRWRPFLLGPIFAQQGWTTSPFNLYPAKGKNMFRDLERICAKTGLRFVRPEPFPQNSLLAARVACALDEAQVPDFSREVYAAEFGEGAPIDSPDVMAGALAHCGLEARAIIERATSSASKERLTARTAEAQALEIFGAPTFITGGGELFWGNDRLEDAVEWAAKES